MAGDANVTDRVVDALLRDYEQAREDERHFQALQSSAIAVALTALSLLGAVAFVIGGNTRVPDVILAGAPLMVLTILAFIQAGGAIAVIRNYYMRALERDLRAAASLPHSLSGYPNLPPMSLIELQTTATSLNPDSSRSKHSFQPFMTAFVFSAVWIVFGGLVVYLALNVTLAWQMMMLLVYGGSATFIFINVIMTNRRDHEFFARHVSFLRDRIEQDLLPQTLKSRRPTGPRVNSRSFLSYTLLPRPDDLIKGPFLFAGVMLAVLSSPTIRGDWASILGDVTLLWVGAELLLYQARYQWNDIRGRVEDRVSPQSEGRGRLPEIAGVVPKTLLALVARVYLAAVIVAIDGADRNLGLDLPRALTVGFVLIFGLAVLYELVKTRLRRSGRCSQLTLAVILTLVGLGYPVRFVIGWLAVTSQASPALWWALVGLWGLGVAFVSMTWMLEAASYFRVTRNLELVPCADITTKPHLNTLLRAARVRTRDWNGAARPVVDGGATQALRVLTRPSLTPWGIGSAIWLVSVCAAGGSLVGLDVTANLVTALAVGGVVMIPASGRWELLLQWLCALAGLGICLSQAMAVAPEPEPHAALRLLLWVSLPLVPAALFTALWSQSYAATRALFHRMLSDIANLAAKAYAVIVGDSPAA